MPSGSMLNSDTGSSRRVTAHQVMAIRNDRALRPRPVPEPRPPVRRCRSRRGAVDFQTPALRCHCLHCLGVDRADAVIVGMTVV